MMALLQKSQVIALLKQYKSALAWFISSLVIAVLLSLGTPNQQPATASNPSHPTLSTQVDVTATHSEFAATHLEPNFYQN